MVAQDTLSQALRAPYIGILHGSAEVGEPIWNTLDEFDSGNARLEQLIRKHVRGESLGETVRPD
jgi:hypothetical protein